MLNRCLLECRYVAIVSLFTFLLLVIEDGFDLPPEISGCNFISYFTTEFSTPCSAKKDVCVCEWVKGGGAVMKCVAR